MDIYGVLDVLRLCARSWGTQLCLWRAYCSSEYCKWSQEKGNSGKRATFLGKTSPKLRPEGTEQDWGGAGVEVTANLGNQESSCDFSFTHSFTSAQGQEARKLPRGLREQVCRGENVECRTGTRLWRDWNAWLRSQVGRGHWNFR